MLYSISLKDSGGATIAWISDLCVLIRTIVLQECKLGLYLEIKHSTIKVGYLVSEGLGARKWLRRRTHRGHYL